MKPILIGLHNPYSSNPANALVPWPERSAGHRLWRMLADLPDIAVPLSVFHAHLWDHSYWDAFDRRNLCPEILSKQHQRQTIKGLAARMKDTFPRNVTVVLLGREVLDAFNGCLENGSLKPILIHPQVVDGITWRWLPHPSGRVTQYNDPVIRALAGLMLADVLAATGEQ